MTYQRHGTNFGRTILLPLLSLASSCHIPVDRKAILPEVHLVDPYDQRKACNGKYEADRKRSG